MDFEHSLNKAVKRLREALEDSAEEPQFIETLPRRGYRFIGTAVKVAAPPANREEEKKHRRLRTPFPSRGVAGVPSLADLGLAMVAS